MSKLRNILLSGAMATTLTACGGGGGSSAAPAASPNPSASANSSSAPTPTGGSSNSAFVSGNFQSSSVFKDSCGAPRANTASDTFPDMQGSFEDEGHWLRSWSNETYLWYDEIQDRDPGLYATSAEGVAAYFDLLKTQQTTPSGNPKDRYHFTRDTAEYRAESEQGLTFGYGATYRLISTAPPSELVSALVEADAPGAQAGRRRGARSARLRPRRGGGQAHDPNRAVGPHGAAGALRVRSHERSS